MQNEDFLDSVGVVDREVRTKCLEAMEKYGENRWWLPEIDLRTFAYYQLNGSVLLCTWEKFHEGIELLLGRPVWTHEFGLNLDALKKSAYMAYVAGPLTEEGVQKEVSQAFQSLTDYAEKNGKQVIGVFLGEGEKHDE